MMNVLIQIIHCLVNAEHFTDAETVFLPIVV